MSFLTVSPVRRGTAPDLDAALHDLHHALAPILLSVEVLRRRVCDPDTQRQLDLMAGHAWRGAAIVRRIAGLQARPRPARKRRPRNPA